MERQPAIKRTGGERREKKGRTGETKRKREGDGERNRSRYPGFAASKRVMLEQQPAIVLRLSSPYGATARDSSDSRDSAVFIAGRCSMSAGKGSIIARKGAMIAGCRSMAPGPSWR